MVLKERIPQKACPWWVRFAEAPNGLILAQCSSSAARKEKRDGRIWEGPEKVKGCVLGYSWRDAQDSPALILYNPRNRLSRAIVGKNFKRPLPDDSWNRITEEFFDWAKMLGFNTPEELQKIELQIQGTQMEVFIKKVEEIISG